MNLILIFRCQIRALVAGLPRQTWYQSIHGEILSQFDVKNIFLTQKLTKWHHFKEIYGQKH